MQVSQKQGIGCRGKSHAKNLKQDIPAIRRLPIKYKGEVDDNPRYSHENNPNHKGHLFNPGRGGLGDSGRGRAGPLCLVASGISHVIPTTAYISSVPMSAA